MRTSRRKFAKLVAGAVATAPLLAHDAIAQTPATPPDKPVEGSQTLRLSEAQTGVLRARYGEHLTKDEIRTIEKDLDESAGYLKPMLSFDLKNSDEPDLTFFALGGPRR